MQEEEEGGKEQVRQEVRRELILQCNDWTSFGQNNQIKY